jgi:hypothetical protein
MFIRPCAIVMLSLVLAASTSSAESQAPAPGAAPPNPFGEPVKASTNHLTVAAAISQTTVSPGARVTLSVDVTPRRTMHVYAPGKHDYQVVGLSITPEPWLQAAATKYPESESYHFEPLNETIPVYSKPFRLTREVAILDTPEARQQLAAQSAVTIAGVLEYQACDDKLCYAPTKVPLRFTVVVKK